jgi:hypothetical protein
MRNQTSETSSAASVILRATMKRVFVETPANKVVVMVNPVTNCLVSISKIGF